MSDTFTPAPADTSILPAPEAVEPAPADAVENLDEIDLGGGSINAAGQWVGP